MLEISITKLDTSSSRASKHHKTNQQPETAKSKRKNPIWPKWQTRPISLLIARVGGQKARIENSIQKILEIFILTIMVIYQQADRQTDLCYHAEPPNLYLSTNSIAMNRMCFLSQTLLILAESAGLIK